MFMLVCTDILVCLFVVRSARFHKFFGYRDIMLALARSSAHHEDSKAMKIVFDYLL